MTWVNEAKLSGRAVKDAARTGNGPWRFSIATGGGRKKDGSGNWPTEFFDIVCWHASAGEVKRGAEVLVIGRLRQSSWETNGQKHSRVEVVATSITDANATEPVTEPKKFRSAFAGDAPPTMKKYELPTGSAIEHAQKVAPARPITANDPISDDDVPL